MNNSPQLQEVLEKINTLPELFHIAVKVSKMLDDIDADVNEIAKVIMLDQALTTRLLKLCNSAHYGFSRKIVSISDAVSKLGFKTLKGMIYLVISHSTLNQEIKGYDLVKGELWKNSISCAVYARYIAKLAGYHDPEIAFTAGLLRDIGKLMIHEYVGGAYDRIVTTVNTEGVTFNSAEERILGFNHCQIGAAAAQKWNFPSVLTDAIQYHHSLHESVKMECNNLDMVAIIHLADALVMMLGLGIGNDGMMYSMDLKAFEILNLGDYSRNIEMLISEVFELNSEIEAMIGIVNDR